MIVLDTCTVIYYLKRKKYLLIENSYILPFQKKELSKKHLQEYLQKGGLVLPLKSPVFKHKDSNFFQLDPSIYKIHTYDRALKKLLRKKGYDTFF